MSWSPPWLLDLMWVCINLLSSPDLVHLSSLQASFPARGSMPRGRPPVLGWRVRFPLPGMWLSRFYKGSHLAEALSPLLAVKSLASMLTWFKVIASGKCFCWPIPAARLLDHRD